MAAPTQIATQAGMIVLGLALLLVAPKIVGLVMRILGIALILVGIALYRFPDLVAFSKPPWTLLIAAFPAVAGVFLLVVGQGMAKLAVRIAGILLLLSALASLGIISL
ncbi:MAG: hypothetical protein V3T58_08030 [Candidatus Hydrothermarchaeales archaeon]